MIVRTVAAQFNGALEINLPREVGPYRVVGCRYQLEMTAAQDVLPIFQVGQILGGLFCPCWEVISGQGQAFPGGAGGDLWRVCHAIGMTPLQSMTFFRAYGPAPEAVFGPQHRVRVLLDQTVTSVADAFFLVEDVPGGGK